MRTIFPRTENKSSIFMAFPHRSSFARRSGRTTSFSLAPINSLNSMARAQACRAQRKARPSGTHRGAWRAHSAAAGSAYAALFLRPFHFASSGKNRVFRFDCANGLPSPACVLLFKFHAIGFRAEAEHVHVLIELMVVFPHRNVLAIESFDFHSFELGRDLLSICGLRFHDSLLQHR